MAVGRVLTGRVARVHLLGIEGVVELVDRLPNQLGGLVSDQRDDSETRGRPREASCTDRGARGRR